MPLVQREERINPSLHGTFCDNCVVDLSTGNSTSGRFAQQRFIRPLRKRNQPPITHEIGFEKKEGVSGCDAIGWRKPRQYRVGFNQSRRRDD